MYFLKLIFYATYNNKKAIIKANNPVASAKANPNIAYVKNFVYKVFNPYFNNLHY